MKTKRCATIAQFGSTIIMHPRLIDVVREIKMLSRKLADACDSQTLIVICGPVGVGKTTVLHMEERAVINASSAEMAEDPAYLPVVKICVGKVAEGWSTWKHFWGDFLGKYCDAMIGNKSLPETKTKGSRNFSMPETIEALRQAVKNQVQLRRTKRVFIDEVQHLLNRGQLSSEEDNLDALKRLATKSRVIVVAAGPYELKTLVSSEEQLIHWVRFIHFRAYGASEQDHKDFYATVWHMEALLPIPFAKDVKIETLFEGSLGCIGLLKNWLVAAVQRASSRSGNEVTQDDILHTMFSGNDLTTLARGISLGEAAFNWANGVRTSIRLFLGLPEESEVKEPETARKFSPDVRHPRRDNLR